MFGYVVADKNTLSEHDSAVYKQIYCGLCRKLNEKYGFVGRMSLNYDMVFLILVLSSLYEPEPRLYTKRCIVHPFQPRECLENEITEYAADMNVLLSERALLDKFNDEGSHSAKRAAEKLSVFIPAIKEKYPHQFDAVNEGLSKLSDIEENNITVPDIPAKVFGEILQAVFHYKKDIWTGRLSAAAYSLGKFIYTMDAVCDLKKDIKSLSYNPLKEIYAMNTGERFYHDILTMQIADCADEFELLPLSKYEDIIKNILYSGVWQRYDMNNSILNKGR